VVVTDVAASVWDVRFAGASIAGTNVAQTTATDVDLAGAGHAVSVATHNPGGTTRELTFTPALVAGHLPVDNAVITFLPQQIEIKIGNGNCSYTEKNNYDYTLDRGNLDTVRQGDEAPMEVKLDFVYEFVTTGTAETITPIDALKKQGGAAGWFSSAADQCEPYATDIEVEYVPPCGSIQKEITLFPDFRSESREFNFKDATINVSGRCNASEPIVTRS
jgi:hypothetical protein